jgi:hypothetical protein
MSDLKLEQELNIQISVLQLIKSFRSRLLLCGLIIVCCNVLVIIAATVNEPVHKSKVLVSVFEARGVSGDMGMQVANAERVFRAAFPDASHATKFSIEARGNSIIIDTSAKTQAELKTLTQGASEAVLTVAKEYAQKNRLSVKQKLESAIIEHDRVMKLERKVQKEAESRLEKKGKTVLELGEDFELSQLGVRLRSALVVSGKELAGLQRTLSSITDPVILSESSIRTRSAGVAPKTYLLVNICGLVFSLLLLFLLGIRDQAYEAMKSD